MNSLNYILRKKGLQGDVRSILYHIARAIKYINFSLRTGNTGVIKTKNTFGEQQMQLDVLADNIIENELERSDLVALISSEEREKAKNLPAKRGQYSVAYDPLDGSSLVDSNLTIGSIFGIWKGESIVGQTGNDMLAACYAIYGPQVKYVIALKNCGVFEFEMNDIGEFLLVRENFVLAETSKYFAPGNLRCTQENEKYLELVNSYIQSQRTLRYSGGMVPDLHHILSKGSGIFTYPRDKNHPNGKLRLAFECAPFAFIFREAAGLTLDQEGNSVLDLVITADHQTTPIFIGSKKEVELAVAKLNK